MELRHLRYFVAVADELSFTRAAVTLRVAQPSLSQQIRQLERLVGAPLFDRSKGRRGVSLTAVGEVLLAEARGILDHVVRSTDIVQRAVMRRPVSLRVGVPPWLPPAFVAGFVDQVAGRLPELECDLESTTTSEAVRHLREESFDLAFVRMPLSDMAGLQAQPVLEQPLGLWLPPAHRLRKYRSVPLEALDGEVVAIFDRAGAPGLYDEIMRTVSGRGLAPLWQEVTASDTAVLSRMRARGIAHVGPYELPGPAQGMTWRTLRGQPFVLRTSLAWRGEGNPLVQAAVRLVVPQQRVPGLAVVRRA